MRNYMDSLTMYYNCRMDIRKLFKAHWIYCDKSSNRNLHHYCIKTEYAFFRFYPMMFGTKRLYVTCSLPKLYRHSNDNTYNITDYDNDVFMDRLREEMDSVLDSSRLPTALCDWKVSRMDLFRMRKINPADRSEYMSAYSRLSYRGAEAVGYLNTTYLSSSRNTRRTNLLLRMYDKTVERQDRRSMLYGNLPAAVEKKHEQLMMNLDVPEDLYRYEFSMRRAAAKRFFKKYKKPDNMETVMDEAFQKDVLNELVISRGLCNTIYCKNEFRKAVGKIFRTEKSRKLALSLAESIRNKKPTTLTKSQRYRIKRELERHSVSTATTNFVTIKGLDLLK